MTHLNNLSNSSDHNIFINENSLRTSIISELKLEGARVWDCRFEDCPEKVVVDGIPFKVIVGDIIFRYKNILRLLELKFLRRYCSKGIMRLYCGQTTPAQIKALAERAGFYVMVAEPMIFPRSKCLSCEERLELLYELLEENKVCYEAVILNSEDFFKVKEQYIDNLKPISGTLFETQIENSYKNVSFIKVQKIIPNSFLCFKLNNIKKLVKEILSKV